MRRVLFDCFCAWMVAVDVVSTMLEGLGTVGSGEVGIVSEEDDFLVPFAVVLLLPWYPA